jgi:hypothetical protein
MSTFIIHLLIPPLIVLSTGFFRARHVWTWVWVGVIGDIDYIGHLLYVAHIVPVETHRAILHNLWLFFILAGVSYFQYRTFRQAGPSPGNAFQTFAHTPHGAAWLLSTYYYFSHLLLDSFQGGIVPFWPLWDRNVFFEFILLVNTRTQEVIPHAEAQAEPGGAPELTPVYAWLDSEQTAFILLLVASLLFGYAVRRLGREIRMIRAVRIEPAPTMRPAGPAGPDTKGPFPPKTGG